MRSVRHELGSRCDVSHRQEAQRAGRTMRPVGNAQVDMMVTRGSKEGVVAQCQLQHLVKKGIRVPDVEL